MSSQPETVDYRLSSFPPLGGDATLLVGLEPGPDGALKAYLGARYLHTYVLVEDHQAQEAFRSAWGSGQMVWLSPVPPLQQDPRPEPPPDACNDGICDCPEAGHVD